MQRIWDFKDSILAEGGDSFIPFLGHHGQWCQSENGGFMPVLISCHELTRPAL